MGNARYYAIDHHEAFYTHCQEYRLEQKAARRVKTSFIINNIFTYQSQVIMYLFSINFAHTQLHKVHV